MNNSQIDIVLYWVDSNDEKWKLLKSETARKVKLEWGSDSNIRYESWNNLRYWFRAVEKNMPWFHKIVFITCGHIPDFLNIHHPKIEWITHKDYIPDKYLPTFNSSAIEMNVHRIKRLEENFILFNDDMFPLLPIEEDYYFKNNKVCDEAVENIITTSAFGSVANMARYFQVNNMFIINKYFSKRTVQMEHPEKWFCEEYGDRLERTKSLVYWNDFSGFYDPHVPSALKKSTLKKLWEIEGEKLDRASRNQFRSHNDLTQYLIRYWQLCQGDFYPRRTQGKVFFIDINNYTMVSEAIRKKQYQMICFNENCSEEEFVIIRDSINVALEEIFPEKSSFEK